MYIYTHTLIPARSNMLLIYPPPPQKKVQKKFNFKYKKIKTKTIKPTFLQYISRNEMKVKEYEQIEITFKSYV